MVWRVSQSNIRSVLPLIPADILLFYYSFFACVKRPILSQITQIHADKRQVGQMDLLKQMPQITLRKTDTT